ncbi:MAG: cyclic pyranopterin monophosphate synthase MoaC [Gemmatimonadota bacterium]|nr:cyclic pyranopterin monophosphate synthase MoaC [Gemmatimonadota bacterium]MDH3427025.1 cyclic pyranopterin monophosphate synthase MoaC [Gemmatimonadota bacterium]
MDSEPLTHLDEHGHARMVDVGDKPVSRRRATAEGRIRMERETLLAIRAGGMSKGDVLAVARLAAIGGAKRTADTIPLCHTLPLDSVAVEVELDAELPGIRIRVETSVEARTGVEMEALCGVSAGLLAVYDMCKGMDRGMQIGEIQLVAKQGGRSGVWRRPDDLADPRA